MSSTIANLKASAFDHTKVTVIFVLGGPGAGKGTLCSLLVKGYDFVHLSAGDLLRAEQHREGSQYGEIIRTCIREGTIVPMEITVKLLENAMHDALKQKAPTDVWANGKGRFLVDGFPRKMDQAIKFDEEVCKSSLVLFYSCTEEIMLERLLERGKTSGREDDNVEIIKKRFLTYEGQTKPVIEHYAKLGKVAEIDGTRKVDPVYQDTARVVDALFAGKVTV
ncbi:UMP-CMP kinase [Ramaria rubella]|nr:UMP-CMP kinase [Ramaria rubella]